MFLEITHQLFFSIYIMFFDCHKRLLSVMLMRAVALGIKFTSKVQTSKSTVPYLVTNMDTDSIVTVLGGLAFCILMKFTCRKWSMATCVSTGNPQCTHTNTAIIVHIELRNHVPVMLVIMSQSPMLWGPECLLINLLRKWHDLIWEKRHVENFMKFIVSCIFDELYPRTNLLPLRQFACFTLNLQRFVNRSTPTIEKIRSKCSNTAFL